MSNGTSRVILWVGFLVFFAFSGINLLHHPLSAATTQVDEQAHISYAIHLVTQHRWWPNFSDFHMVDTATLKLLTAGNYLNHPPTFYWLMKAMSIVNAIDFRLVAIAFTTAAMLLYMQLGVKLKLPLIGSIAYAALPFLLNVYLQVGFYNNDAAALFGGMLATYASFDWFAKNHPRRAFWLMIFGVVFASVKLTAFMLVGIYVLSCILPAWRSIARRDWLLAILIGIVLLLPYAMMLHLYGNLAPETAGQLHLMQHPTGEHWVRTPYHGWAQQIPMGFLQWLGVFLSNFADQMDGVELAFIPLLLLVAGFSRMTKPEMRRQYPMQFAGAVAMLVTLAVHIAYAWHRYQTYGWLLDSLTRYYFPLLGVVGAVCASVVTRWRKA